jgi:hypothetical protein
MDAACSTPATSSATESSAVAIGGTAGGLLSIFAIVFGIVSWRAYKRSIAPIDFKVKLQEMIASGEIEVGPGDTVASDLPREIQRRYLTKMETIGRFASYFCLLLPFVLLRFLRYKYLTLCFLLFHMLYQAKVRSAKSGNAFLTNLPLVEHQVTWWLQRPF